MRSIRKLSVNPYRTSIQLPFRSFTMAPKQGTLNKWFAGPAAQKKADPQQTKLKLQPSNPQKRSISNGSSSKAAETFEKDDEPEVADGASDVHMKDSTSSAEPEKASDEDAKPASKHELSEEEEEDDSPRSRKRRRTTELKTKYPKPSKSNPSKPAQNGKEKGKQPAKVKDEEDEDEGSLPVRPSRSSNGVKDAKNKKPNIKEEVKSPPSTAIKEDDAKSDVEMEDIEEDEEKPEDQAKDRQKILTLLKGSGKDPYPDWKAGAPVPYAALCTTFHKIEMTTKRLEILAHCSLFLRQVLRLTPDDLLETVLLMINKLGADYTGIELGIGESLIMKAIGESTGRSLQVIKKDQQEIGDLGLVAAKSRSNQPTMFKPQALTVRGVFKGLKDIALIEGQGSQGRKVAGIKKLLSAADAALGKGVDITQDKGGPSEAKYIVRTLEGKLRLGLADKSVLVALAQAVVFHRTEYVALSEGKKVKPPGEDAVAKGESTLKSVYSELPSYEVIIPALIASDYQLESVRDKCKLQPGIPLKPMLAKPTKSITEVLDRFEGKHFTCEYKYDGERAQIHFVAHDAPEKFATQETEAGKSEKGIANVFSRNSEDLSKKYPDILAKLPTWVKDGTKSFVLDCESVAWDVDEKKVLPFQQLMTRKRKDVKTEDIKVKVCVFAFDLLFLNGEALVNKSFRERRDLLHDALIPVEGEFAFAKFGDTNDLEEIQSLLEDSVKSGCEGLMVKMLDGPASSYEPSKRSQNWLKVKKDYLAGVGDSLDLVVLGAYFGRGKRTSVYGAFLLACWNDSKEAFESVCNIGTGFSDEMLATLHETLSKEVIGKAKPFYTHPTGNKDQPDVWFEPKFVWEVKTADLTLSPRYRAAENEVGGDGKGVSLRFPRFIKIRDDKKPDQATTSRAVAEMYRKQESVSKNKGPSVDDDFEY